MSQSSSLIQELTAGYPAVITLPVQWGDMDALSHVNNVVYFRWLESSRIKLVDRVVTLHQTREEGIGPILASVKCDYRRQTHYPDTVHVASRVGKVGRSSITLKQIVVSEEQGAVVAEGEAILVLYNYLAGNSVPITDSLREALLKLS